MTATRARAPAQPLAEARRAAIWRASVIVVNYNGGPALGRCVQAALASLETSDELLLVDNASTDGSIDQLELSGRQARLVRSAANGGFGAGNDLGASLARGEFLVFLNPDTVAAPGWLSALLAPLIADGGIGLSTAKLLLEARPGVINTCGNAVHVSGLTLCREMGEPSTAYRQQQDVAAVSGAAFAMRRSLFEALGGFDEAFFMYLEDTDLSLRARLAGWRIVCAAGSVVAHDYQLRFGPGKVFYQERNRYWMLIKTLRWGTLAALLPALALAEMVTWGFVLLGDRAHWTNKPRAYAATAQSWPALMQARRATQRLRRVPDRELLGLTAFRLDYGQTGLGLAARVARALFDPAFWLLRAAALAVVWW